MREKHSIFKPILALLMMLAMAVTMAVPAMASTKDHWNRDNSSPTITDNKVSLFIKDIYRQGDTLQLKGWICNGYNYPIVNTSIKNLSVISKNTGEAVINNASFVHRPKIYPKSYSDFSITVISENWKHNVDFSKVGNLHTEFHYTCDNEMTAKNSHYTKSNMKYINWNDGLQARVVDARYGSDRLSVKMEIKNNTDNEVEVTYYKLKVVADHKTVVSAGSFSNMDLKVAPHSTITHTFNFVGQDYYEIDLGKINYLECSVLDSVGYSFSD